MQGNRKKYIISITCLVATLTLAANTFAQTGNTARRDRERDQQEEILSVESDSLANVELQNPNDTTQNPKEVKPFLSDILVSTNKDSMIYDIATNRIFIYNEGNVDYQDKNLNADYIDLNIVENVIVAKGTYKDPKEIEKAKEKDSDKSSDKKQAPTTTYNVKSSSTQQDTSTYNKPKFKEGETTYDMDSIIYNIKSEKAKIYGIAFQEGEGTLRGKDIKKMDNGIYNIHDGIYSTCDADCPHFYISLNKAQYVKGEKDNKVIFGGASLVLEDVKLPLWIPFGFFPMLSDKNSGIIFPEIGEENSKGFYVRDLGYYFVFNDYLDATLTAGIYTYGSWETALASAYKVRYKYSGNISINYAADKYGVKGSSDYYAMNNYSVKWTHSQDSKFKPGSTFSASVNYATSAYSKYDSQSISDYVSAQTNSSISYSKTWTGTPFSLSTSMQHSQNNRDSSVVLSLPNFVFNVQRIYPFQRKNAVGAQRWYEKISFSYTNNFNNSISTTETEMFTEDMFENMNYGMKHTIPVTTSINLLKYFTLSPTVSYNERWYFSKINKEWDQVNQELQVTDTTSGFFRAYDYNLSLGLTTKLYGMYTFKGKDPAIKAIRHVLTPTISGSYAPDFSDPKYGFYVPVQSSVQGTITQYSPFEGGIYGVPSTGRTASLSLSLGNTLEMKVRSETDTTGVKLVKILESLSLSTSYNFLADSLNLSNITASARTTLFKSMGISATASFDPYALNSEGEKINKFALSSGGSLARMTSFGMSFGYSFRSIFGYSGEGSGTGSESLPRAATTSEQEFFDRNGTTYADQQTILGQGYYNFSVPWNLSLNYSLSYSKPLLETSITQTVSFSGNVNLTSKFGVTFSGGIDLQTMDITPGTIGLTRDLHCWQFSFNWVPVGFRKSWNFCINVKSGMLSDLKYEKSSGYTNNYSSYY